MKKEIKKVLENIQINQNERTHGLWCVFKNPKDENYYLADMSFVNYDYECIIFHSDKDGNVGCWIEVFERHFNNITTENLLECVEAFIEGKRY